jgi:hypothetical protein
MGVPAPINLETDINFPSDLATVYTNCINIAYKKIHDRFDFPDLVTIEQRTPDSNHYIGFEQVGLSAINRVLKVYPRDPRVTYPPMDMPFRNDANGIHVGYDHGTTVWIRYVKPAPRFSAQLWSSAGNYNKDTPIYDGPIPGQSGDVYKALQGPPNTNHPPISSPTWWELILIPESIHDLILRYAFAEALREDGQFDKAAQEEQAVIQEAISKIAALVGPPFDTVSDQSRPASRYRPPAFNIPFPSGGGK